MDLRFVPVFLFRAASVNERLSQKDDGYQTLLNPPRRTVRMMTEGHVIYDSDCRFCRKTVKFLEKIDRKDILKFIPGSEAEESGYEDDRCGVESVVYVKDGREYRKSDAILEVLWDVGGMWKIVKILKIFPPQARDTIYDFVARHRGNLC